MFEVSRHSPFFFFLSLFLISPLQAGIDDDIAKLFGAGEGCAVTVGTLDSGKLEAFQALMEARRKASEQDLPPRKKIVSTPYSSVKDQFSIEAGKLRLCRDGVCLISDGSLRFESEGDGVSYYSEQSGQAVRFGRVSSLLEALGYEVNDTPSGRTLKPIGPAQIDLAHVFSRTERRMLSAYRLGPGHPMGLLIRDTVSPPVIYLVRSGTPLPALKLGKMTSLHHSEQGVLLVFENANGQEQSVLLENDPDFSGKDALGRLVSQPGMVEMIADDLLQSMARHREIPEELLPEQYRHLTHPFGGQYLIKPR